MRSLILLAIVVWVGGLLFFGAVVTQVAFGTLMPMFPEASVGLQVAGTMVRDSLTHLHDIGLFCGAALLLLCIIERVTHATQRSIGPPMLLVAVMMGLTAYSQFSVIPRMETLRIKAGAAMADAGSTNPARVDFNRLHNLSTSLEGIVLLCGLGLIVLYARPEPIG
ncbi:MAG TPA: DUF4149 domain-containing protein [Acidobacteriaceae bacterium]|nr:DUF4149 domain-containing protein [Acidobacteriaceae bacterium]